MSGKFLRFALLCIVGVLPLRVPSVEAQTTALLIDSQAGDVVGGGVRQTWTGSELTVSSTASWPARIGLVVETAGAGGSTTTRYFQFAPANDNDPLTPGIYEDASNYGYPKRPLFMASGPGRCAGNGNATGRFVVYEVAFDTGGRLVRFAADFEQQCPGVAPALFGAIRINAARDSLIPFDGAYPVYAMHVERSPFGQVNGPDLDCGMAGTACDVSYSAASTVTLTATPAPGYVFLGWTGECFGSLAQTVVFVSRRKSCGPVFEAAPGSGLPPPFGGGNFLFIEQRASPAHLANRWVFRESDAAFGVEPPFDDYGNRLPPTITFDVAGYNGRLWWLKFTAPRGQLLAPGVYERTSKARFDPGATPGLTVSVPDAPYCQTERGRFVVYEIAYDVNGNLTRFAADFEDHCDNDAGVVGALRFNATRTAVLPFDGVDPQLSLTIEPPINGTVTGPGIACGGGDVDCQETYGVSGPVTLLATPAPGHMFVGWTGDCSGASPTTITVITHQVCGAVFDDPPPGPLADDLRLGSLALFSQPGDYVGGGLRFVATRADTLLQAITPGYFGPPRDVTFWVLTPDGETWSIGFAAPAGQALSPGDFEGAVSKGEASSASRPSLWVDASLRFCSTATGRFRIYQLERDSTGRVTAFAADFEQHCNGAVPALFGAIRYNSTRVSVLPYDGMFLPRLVMSLDMPVEGGLSAPTVTVAGWALHTGASSDTGVDAIHIYAFPFAGGPPVFLGAASYGMPRPDVGAVYGVQFTNSGFALTSPALGFGRYAIAAYAHNAHTGTFEALKTATITISPPVTQPRMEIDAPAGGVSLTTALAIDGWAIDAGALNGPGIDAVHVYAVKAGSSTPLFLGVASYGVTRSDIAAIFGPQFSGSGYHLAVSGLSSGVYTIYVYARSTISGQFAWRAKTVTLIPTAMAIDATADGGRVSGAFSVSGWAFDSDAASGAGVDAVHVWAFPAGGGAPLFLGAATLHVARPDLGAMFGARFADAGFTLTAPSLTPGTYTIGVFAHSAATGTFNQSRAFTLFVD